MAERRIFGESEQICALRWQQIELNVLLKVPVDWAMTLDKGRLELIPVCMRILRGHCHWPAFLGHHQKEELLAHRSS